MIEEDTRTPSLNFDGNKIRYVSTGYLVDYDLSEIERFDISGKPLCRVEVAAFDGAQQSSSINLLTALLDGDRAQQMNGIQAKRMNVRVISW